MGKRLISPKMPKLCYKNIQTFYLLILNVKFSANWEENLRKTLKERKLH